ncbi:uncharacterized protein N7459_007105 [Penicillium hispanicum]|uniref:uncharacterized protein n=1 Tax=Penicillium hispanicum TaxID=1080232 RepID=UPI0025413FCA|nr:uncharacterized protein N7459_007105 [Penicillium hispanicum]KAJ5578141.1 hypothetical protein N7459_007105 [Penicillium hispanicum]
MSLFGQQNQTPSGGGLFGNSANKPSPFGGLGGSTSTTPTQSTGGGMFGAATQNQQQGTTGSSLFGTNTTSQPQQTSGLFGSTATSQPQQSGNLFGSSTQQKPLGGGLFGGAGSGQQQQASTGTGGLFGGGLNASTQQQQQPPQQPPQQQQGGMFGSSLVGAQQQQPQQQPSQFGQTTMVQPQTEQQQQSLSSSLWSPGRAITGVHRTVPMQIAIIKDKWDPPMQSSPFRAYLYNQVGEDASPFYQPGPEDDDMKWEEALRKRPDSGYVPVLVKGFWELGKRAQRQKDFLAMMQTRLHEINNCLTDLLSRHELKISLKVADCRRKHLVLSKRCLALAAKTQVLRNRGYAMDDAEEELKKKLTQLERSVFDPSLNGRGEEIWARMLAIHEQSKRLQAEIDRAGPNVAARAEDEIDEQTMKTAKKILDDYHAQIQHLNKELASVKKEFEEAQKLNGN